MGHFQYALVMYRLGLLIFMITSCQGQSQRHTHTQQDQGVSDPMFYIDGQLCQHVRTIFQDQSGHLWFGTNVYGLIHYSGDTLNYYTEKDGVGRGRITGITEDDAGNVWICGYGGLTRFDGQSFTNFIPEKKDLSFDIWDMIIDSAGLFWLGTMDGVVQFDGKEFSRFPLPKARVPDTTTILSYDRVTAVMQDARGVMWFGTDGFGISLYDGHGFSHFTEADGLCGNNISDIWEDRKGDIWISTMYGGISRWDGHSFANYMEDGVIAGVECTGFYEDREGYLWFAAENQGVYRYDGKSFGLFDKTDGLNTLGILCFFQDNKDRFWLGGWGGLFRFDGQQFTSVVGEGPWK